MPEPGVQSIVRALDILELLSMSGESLGVSEIARQLGLNKSTTHRILGILLERGYVDRSGRDARYRAGLRMVDLASVRLHELELKAEAYPVLSDLNRRTGFSAHMAILDGNQAVYIEKIDSPSRLRLYSQIGRRIPLHCTALGKVLLAGLPDRVLEPLLSRLVLSACTHRSRTTAEDLRAELDQVRRLGWATDDEEHEQAVRCVAAPVRDYRNRVVAAVSLSGPAVDLSLSPDQWPVKAVLSASRTISERMGARPEEAAGPSEGDIP